MPETVFHGKGSNAYWEETAVSQLTGWSCSMACDTAESTVNAAATTGKTRVAGFKGGTCSITTLLEGDNVIDEGAEGTIQLHRTGTASDKGYRGEAICTGVEVGVDMNGVETTTYNFQWTGAVISTVIASGADA